ncbi:MAG: glycosyltransferase [Candidatus Auribacterota bacterium]|jgi:cellulose synthase/poly-beta-1,6-N-acetylglucosamine synthase-like glycosyltransferase|nr:glycosyltransferase [Candidatus Auribacterota bacterium]
MVYPFVSVIVPAYNAEKTMSLCIESLISQDYPKDKYEIIIVDNNSTDETAEIIKSYSVTYLLEDKIQTSYAARNTGIRHAKGEILAFTDADCIADKNWLKEGVKAFADSTIAAISGNMLPYKPETWIELFQSKQNVLNHAILFSESRLRTKAASIATGNAFFRKMIFDKVGFFYDQWIGGADTDMSYKIQRETDFKLAYFPDAIVYHKHRTSLKELWKQYVRYGQSDIMIRYKYHWEKAEKLKADSGQFKPFYWRIRATIIQASLELIKIFLLFLITGGKYKTELSEAFLNLYIKTAHFYGSCKVAIKNKIPLHFFLPQE